VRTECRFDDLGPASWPTAKKRDVVTHEDGHPDVVSHHQRGHAFLGQVLQPVEANADSEPELVTASRELRKALSAEACGASIFRVTRETSE
jgi:hypothetical protein